MNAKQLAAHYENLTAELIELDADQLRRQIKEYRHLYKAVYNLTTEPIEGIRYRLKNDKAYVIRVNYVEFLKDLALIRDKFTYKKYKGGKK